MADQGVNEIEDLFPTRHLSSPKPQIWIFMTGSYGLLIFSKTPPFFGLLWLCHNEPKWEAVIEARFMLKSRYEIELINSECNISYHELKLESA